MSNYEFVYIIPLKYPENEIPQIINQVSETIKKNGFTVVKEENWGKRKIAYPIKQNRHGYFIFNELKSSPKNLAKLNQDLLTLPEILRFTLIKSKPEDLKSKISKKPAERETPLLKKSEMLKLGLKDLKIPEIKASSKTARENEPEKKSKIAEKPKIALEDLDKKLDEILSDETFNT